MDGGFGFVKAMLPLVPTLASTAAWHTMGMTPTSSQWDLRTELTVGALRHWMSGKRKPSSIKKVQGATLKDPGVKGKTWVAKATMKAPPPQDEGVRDAVCQAIKDMKPKDAGSLHYVKPELVDVEVEWTGFREDAKKDEPLPEWSEEEKYKALMSEPSRTSNTTILYFHGGAYYLCDPITHRAPTSRLAKESHGRVCNVRYRLAPQTAFPGQLLDAFLAYLSLLYPPPGSMHEAVAAHDLVFGGDSAGGNLSFALLQLLLHFHRTPKDSSVRFHGKDVKVPLPAGVTANSGWFDISRSLPSLFTNSKYDYLPPPKHDDAISTFAHDDIWPTTPPRGDIFCDLTLIDHPLASPLASESWEGAPPLWLCDGEEMLADEIESLGSRAVSQGVIVQLEKYGTMPHVFQMLLPSLPTSDRCMRSWGDFCRRCVDEPSNLKTQGTFIHPKSGKEENLDVMTVSKISFEEVLSSMRDAKERRMKGYEKEGKSMPKPSL